MIIEWIMFVISFIYGVISFKYLKELYYGLNFSNLSNLVFFLFILVVFIFSLVSAILFTQINESNVIDKKKNIETVFILVYVLIALQITSICVHLFLWFKIKDKDTHDPTQYYLDQLDSQEFLYESCQPNRPCHLHESDQQDQQYEPYQPNQPYCLHESDQQDQQYESYQPNQPNLNKIVSWFKNVFN
jgi:hypothetical protein